MSFERVQPSLQSVDLRLRRPCVLESGYWTEDEDLVGAVQRFLVGLIGASEDIDSAADAVDPELGMGDSPDKDRVDLVYEVPDTKEGLPVASARRV